MLCIYITFFFHGTQELLLFKKLFLLLHQNGFDDGFGNLRSLQVTGIAAMVEPFSEEYNTHAAFRKIPLDALKKLPSPMNLICVTPTRIDALFSDFKKDGYSVRQVLHQLA